MSQSRSLRRSIFVTESISCGRVLLVLSPTWAMHGHRCNCIYDASEVETDRGVETKPVGKADECALASLSMSHFVFPLAHGLRPTPALVPRVRCRDDATFVLRWSGYWIDRSLLIRLRSHPVDLFGQHDAIAKILIPPWENCIE